MINSGRCMGIFQFYLMTYLEDECCSFSNNLSENAIHLFTVGHANEKVLDTIKILWIL